MRPVASPRLTLQSNYFAMLSSSLFVFTRDRFSTSFLIVELLRPMQSQGTFAAFTTSLKPMEEPLKTIRTKLNKEIFHLTKNRTITKQFDVGIDGVEILKMIESEIERFRAGLSAEYQPFECKIAPVEVAGLKFQTSTASSTNHISILNGPPA